ncbi:Isochorismatase hydrolase [Coccomyxa subellipsoidea C-169]|uniref:Isochorismatase hydrolase n=1 Tax=Coccomyxa subellipsoidea (strain C-169) TaxID=574566 RepID=I0Z266_COCSC|nr:Isochorismatase hydrolase [Coccomyxa subellipsoidea C-169]EIE24735.1 Isochorismatase hydrolase [Coccomyxa subellipsoidea C-169]|eukprot:XP_005649279.1 Isochorismatase hydrolase [Coccomyxa subellipsoidea C-169]
MSVSAPHIGRLLPSRTSLFICDVQERFRTTIKGYPAVIDSARRLVRGAAALEIPIICTEQYPKALGSTVQEVLEVLPDACKPVPKTDFTMLVPEVKAQLDSMRHVKQIVLVGIEGHVCVFQTALDLLELGYEVHVVADGVSSSRWLDRAVGLQRIAQSGGFLVTAEMVLFQLTGGSKHPAFKTISNLAKESRPEALPIVSML